MLKAVSTVPGAHPNRRKSSRLICNNSQNGVKYFSIRWNGKASWPAGTGVWVVNTVEAFTTSTASSNGSPA